MEESGVDAFIDSRVGATNSFFVELDNMMVPERSFKQIQGLLLDVLLKLKFEKVKRKQNQDNYVVMRST
eukprot:898162-Ditylum_brightwellii.AAC.1